jgi:hypothetical protein
LCGAAHPTEGHRQEPPIPQMVAARAKPFPKKKNATVRVFGSPAAIAPPA